MNFHFFPCLCREQTRKEREDSHGRSKKRKKEKKKKHRKKKNRDNSESSGSESDTVYPSDLIKKENTDRYVHRKIPQYIDPQSVSDLCTHLHLYQA